MLKLIGLLTILALGFGGGIAWEARPSIGYHLNLLIWHPGFSLPDGWKVQRDHARQSLQTAQDGENRCRLAIQSQNASIAALSAKSTAALAKSSADIAATKPQSDRALKVSRDLAAHVVVGAGELERWRDADAAVVGSLRP